MSSIRLPSAPPWKNPKSFDPPQFGDLGWDDDDAVDFTKELKHMKDSLFHEIQRLSVLEAAIQKGKAKGMTCGAYVSEGCEKCSKIDTSGRNDNLIIHDFEPRISETTDVTAIASEVSRPVSVSKRTEKGGSVSKRMASLWSSAEQQLMEEGSHAGDARHPWSETWDRFCKHKALIFDSFMGGVVLVNTLTIGLSCDVGSDFFWMIVDTAFATLFLMELIIKLIEFRCRAFFFGNNRRWNIFELALVVLAWVEVGLSFVSDEVAESANLIVLIRMFRIARLARLIRVFRLDLFSDIVLLGKGAMGGMRTLFWSSVLIFWPLYIVSVIFRQTLGAIYSNEYFSSVPMSFFTLFRCVVAGECTDELGRPIFHYVMTDHGWGFALIYAALMIFVVLGLFNVIAAIYVENVVAAAKSDDIRLRKQRLSDEEFFNNKMFDLIKVMWEENAILNAKNGRQTPSIIEERILDQVALTLKRMECMEITPELFLQVLQDGRTKNIFEELDVTDEDQDNLFDTLDTDGSGTLELSELYEGIAKLRGPARRSDVVSVEMLVRKLLQDLQASKLSETDLHRDEIGSPKRQSS